MGKEIYYLLFGISADPGLNTCSNSLSEPETVRLPVVDNPNSLPFPLPVLNKGKNQNIF